VICALPAYASPSSPSEQCPRLQKFGDIGTPFRELGWKTPIFYGWESGTETVSKRIAHVVDKGGERMRGGWCTVTTRAGPTIAA
jgi:hypothetical protein